MQMVTVMALRLFLFLVICQQVTLTTLMIATIQMRRSVLVLQKRVMGKIVTVRVMKQTLLMLPPIILTLMVMAMEISMLLFKVVTCHLEP